MRFWVYPSLKSISSSAVSFSNAWLSMDDFSVLFCSVFDVVVLMGDEALPKILVVDVLIDVFAFISFAELLLYFLELLETFELSEAFFDVSITE